MADYPGTPQHQLLIGRFVAFYKDDPRVRALSIFGSLGRGDWDRFSDLDLDVVMADDAIIDIEAEVHRLAAHLVAWPKIEAASSFGQQPPTEEDALVVIQGTDSGDIVLPSLEELSIRYHPLGTTSPNIVDSLIVLHGSVDADAIRAAGRANRHIVAPSAQSQVDQYVRFAVGVSTALHRKRLWQALDLLHRMRTLLVELFALSQGGGRALHVFDEHAPQQVQVRLGATLPVASLRAAQRALLTMLDLVEDDLTSFTGNQLAISRTQRHIIDEVRRRLQTGDLLSEDEELRRTGA